MICVLPCCPADVADMLRLLKWIALLGPCKNHDALIVTDASVPALKALELKAMADGIFKEVRLITNEKPVVGWPNGCNSLFHAAAKYIHGSGRGFVDSWLWLEPDAIPLKVGWLDEISELDRIVEDGVVGHAYIGYIYANSDPRFPKQLMSGVAVYPPDAYVDFEDRILKSPMAWDVDLANVMVSSGVHTPLIHHLWGEYNNPPVFSDVGTIGSNVLCIEQIPKEAVIWHRDKKHSLIRILRRRMFPDLKPDTRIDVVFPVCQHDINQAIHHAKWLVKLGRKYDRRAVVAFDRTCNLVAVQQLRKLLERVFTKLDNFMYPTPPMIAYPHAANWAWQQCAYHMSEQDNPWLWMEADAVVLKAEWIEALEWEYERAGKAFMGPKVKGMGHFNGGTVYPPDTPSRLPSAFRCVEQAWDYMSASEMIPQGHDAAALMQHCWTRVGDELSEVGGGSVPQGCTPELFDRWIKPTAVVFHRWKDNSMIDMLMAR